MTGDESDSAIGLGDAACRLYGAKARAELTQADRMLGTRLPVSGSGDPLGRVLLVKGEPGPEDVATRRALAGVDGEAAAKALEALGMDPSSAWATCSRPRKADEQAVSSRLRLIVEAVDPALVICLDPLAGRDMARALGLGTLAPGVPATHMGRVVGAVDGLEASLGDPAAQARVWRQMRAVAAALPQAPASPQPASRGGSEQGTS